MRAFLTCVFVATATPICDAAQRWVSADMSTAELQNVIDASQSGDVIQFEPGRYEVAASLVIQEKSNLQFKGTAGVLLVCLNPTANVFDVIDSKKVLLRSLRMTHREPAATERCTGNVIFISGGDEITIRDCEINGCGAIGVYAFTARLSVIRCHIHNNSLWPITFCGTHLSLKKNRIENNGDADHIHFGYTLKPGNDWKTNQRIRTKPVKTIEGLEMKQNRFGKLPQQASRRSRTTN